jgi:hypothetical protein
MSFKGAETRNGWFETVDDGVFFRVEVKLGRWDYSQNTRAPVSQEWTAPRPGVKVCNYFANQVSRPSVDAPLGVMHDICMHAIPQAGCTIPPCCYIYLSSVFRSVWTTTDLLFVSVGCGDGLWVGDWGGSRIPPLVPSASHPPQRAEPDFPMSPATQHQNPSPGELNS